jgi:hypothetical protein
MLTKNENGSLMVETMNLKSGSAAIPETVVSLLPVAVHEYV